MTREDLIRMAKEAGVKPLLYDGKWAVEGLDAFAALVAAAEREACAKVAFELGGNRCDVVASAIRAKGQA